MGTRVSPPAFEQGATTKTPRYQGTKSPGHQDTKVPRHQDTKAPRHQGTKTPRHQDTKAQRQGGSSGRYRRYVGAFVPWSKKLDRDKVSKVSGVYR